MNSLATWVSAAGRIKTRARTRGRARTTTLRCAPRDSRHPASPAVNLSRAWVPFQTSAREQVAQGSGVSATTDGSERRSVRSITCKFTHKIQEDHKMPVFGLAFNHCQSADSASDHCMLLRGHPLGRSPARACACSPPVRPAIEARSNPGASEPSVVFARSRCRPLGAAVPKTICHRWW